MLTDLKDEWHFFWLDRHVVKHVAAPVGPNVRRLALSFLMRAIAPGYLVGDSLATALAVIDSLDVPIGKRRKLSSVNEGRSSDSESENGHLSARMYGAESDDDEDDREQLKFRRVRQMIRMTPWLQDIVRSSPRRCLMSEEARTMFG